MKRTSRELAQDRPATYEIKVQGRIDENWSDWFDGMTIVSETSADGTSITTLTGTVVDQAALIGLLRRLHNLHLRLLSVNRVG
jgi:hypothetical protein